MSLTTWQQTSPQDPHRRTFIVTPHPIRVHTRSFALMGHPHVTKTATFHAAPPPTFVSYVCLEKLMEKSLPVKPYTTDWSTMDRCFPSRAPALHTTQTHMDPTLSRSPTPRSLPHRQLRLRLRPRPRSRRLARFSKTRRDPQTAQTRERHRRRAAPGSYPPLRFRAHRVSRGASAHNGGQ
ncbi:hypothetical protein B0H11DRAFT_2061333 [Mycena galericulata]|nr:hypothetical protein B0H11DRAFT_2061333 [Mycena galericulata]